MSFTTVEEAAVFSLIDGFKRRVEAAAAAKNRAAAAELFFSMCCENDGELVRRHAGTSLGALNLLSQQETPRACLGQQS